MARSAGVLPSRYVLEVSPGGLHTACMQDFSVRDIVDLIVRRSLATVCLFDVVSVDAPALADHAQQCGTRVRILDEDVVRFATTDLAAMLAELDHYDLKLLDLPAEVDDDVAYSAVIDASTHARDDGPVLEHLPASTFYLHSHDDCYLRVDTRDRAHALDHLALLLQREASWHTDDVVEPSHDLLERVLGSHAVFSILNEAVHLSDGLNLRYSVRSLAEINALVPPNGTLVYNAASARWTLR